VSKTASLYDSIDLIPTNSLRAREEKERTGVCMECPGMISGMGSYFKNSQGTTAPCQSLRIVPWGNYIFLWGGGREHPSSIRKAKKEQLIERRYSIRSPPLD